MNWRLASFLTLALWGVYSLFAEKAGRVHGARVNLIFEAAAFVLLAVAVSGGSLGEFTKVTQKSFVLAAIMGLSSAVGFYFLLMALQLAPAKLPIIIVVTGMYPVITVVITHFLGMTLLLHQWVGVALATIGVVLVNWI